MEALFGIDIGTTNSKVVVCSENRLVHKVLSCPTPQKTDAEGIAVYDAAELWKSIKGMLQELVREYHPFSIGIASMAEAGVLINRTTGKTISDIIPWHDRRSVACFSRVQSKAFEDEGFNRTGLHNSYKYSVYKLMMLQDEQQADLDTTVWLSVSAYIAYCLTGNFGEDHTLALRTYCYDIGSHSYDTGFMKKMGLPENIFASAHDSGMPVGGLKKEICSEFGLIGSVPVAVCGHDHLCAAVASGALSEEDIFISIGTTAVVLGNFTKRPLTIADRHTGYSYGLHTIPGRMTWMGTIQSAGGAVEWARNITSTGGGSYESMLSLLEEKKDQVTGILFFPYLSGSGAPMLDINVRASLIGLDRDTDRGTLLKAVLEGISYEIRMILEGVKDGQGHRLIKVVGGASRNPCLMQTLADVLGSEVAISNCGQETAVGAALLAAGVLNRVEDAPRKVFKPDPNRHKRYSEIYENGYMRLQQPLRNYFQQGFEGKINR